MNKRNIILSVLVLLLSFALCACGGNVKSVNGVDVESQIYTPDDINSAIEIIKKEFDKSWKGCTLKEIYYAGDETSTIIKVMLI